MPSTRLTELGSDPASLAAMWSALAPEPGGRTPTIRAVMIASLDGSTTVDGRSGGLGTPTDQFLFHAMRARADLVIVGAATAITEGYGPAQPHEAWRAYRGTPPPPVVLLARTLSDQLVEHCTGHGDALAVAVTPDVDRDRIAEAERRGVRVHVLDPGPYGAAVRALATRLGAEEVDFEGGPRLLARLLAEDAVDELVLSLAPEVIVGAHGDPLVRSEGGASARVPLRVSDAFTGPDGGLYTRWVVDRDGR